MKKFRRPFYAIGAALITAAWAATPAGAQDNKPIVIGGTLGLTGMFSDPAADYKAVYDRWLEQVNKKGGLLGRQVKMVIYNDEATPTVAQQLYNRLLDQDNADLGSGLIDYSQKMTMAAMQIADMNV